MVDMIKDINKLGNFVREKRGEMSLRDFAKQCGDISHTQIDSIERGVDPRTGKPVKPTIETLAKIAKGTGVSISYLAALANNENPEQGYYTNPETALLAEEAAKDPDMRLLLDAKRDLPPEDMRMIINLAKRLLNRNDD